ncbi:hypothetical protein UFOVP240_75 [uncultured Caudovirales phage]|uniref:Uncharacterized protein n=1 Tax=uncultured Caudovirales phage TaxID=2100421 RepID=A0A6J7WW38_9CAUD|nr:hypothetical protein UFOVP240_75 [uncultured Caudovirales phage]
MDGLAHAHSLRLNMILRVLASEVNQSLLTKTLEDESLEGFLFYVLLFCRVIQKLVDMHQNLMYTSVSELVVYLPTDIVLLKFGFFCWGIV